MRQSFGFTESNDDLDQETAPQPDSIQTATAVVETLVACGVTDVVVCPGSRSAPLVYALEAARTAGWLRTHVKIDERVAGFYALGLSKGAALRRHDTDFSEASASEASTSESPVAGWRTPSGFAPVAVVVTSGTAVANLHPAFLEAFHTGVPLILVTADRPAYLRGTGANQTTWQAGIFGLTSRFNADLITPSDEEVSRTSVATNPEPDAGATANRFGTSTSSNPGQTADSVLSVPVVTAGRYQVRAITHQGVATAIGATGANPGPVHLNLCLDNPLTPALPWPGKFATKPLPLPIPEAESDRTSEANTATGLGNKNRDGGQTQVPQPGKRSVLVAGDQADPALWEWAIRNCVPVLAEPTSGYFDHPNAVGPVPWILPAASPQIEQVVVTGHPTLSRPVTALLSRRDLPIYVVSDQVEYFDLTGMFQQVSPTLFSEGAPAGELIDYEVTPVAGEWLSRWWLAAQICSRELRLHFQTEWLHGLDTWHLAALTWFVHRGFEADSSLLFLGSSNTIRAFDMGARWPVEIYADDIPQSQVKSDDPAGHPGCGYTPNPSRPPEIFPLEFPTRDSDTFQPVCAAANRGLAGIDGNISTALGMAAASGRETRIVLGDLTFLHDLGALTLGELEAEIDIQIIVFNDGGGSIFAGLEHSNPAFESVFDRYFTTAQRFNLPALAVGLGFEYLSVDNYHDYLRTLYLPARGRTLVEVHLSGPNRSEQRSVLAQKIRQELQERVF